MWTSSPAQYLWPEALKRVEDREGWGQHLQYLSFNAHISPWCRGIPCCMGWCVVTYKDYFSFQVFLGPLLPFLLWALVRGGWIDGLYITVSHWRILRLDVRRTLKTPTASNIRLVLCKDILAANLCYSICLSETFLVSLSAWTHVSSESATNLLTMRWSC